MTKRKIDDIRHNSDDIVSKVDEQAVKNFQLNLEVNNYKSELLHALQRVDEHSYCPGQASIDCMDKKTKEHDKSVAQEVKQEHVHGEDCHCSKCCPNPKPNFFQKHKVGLLIGLIWVLMVFLAIGWTPTGGVADAINNSWVELIVNVFKIGIFAIAGVATYNLVKKQNE